MKYPLTAVERAEFYRIQANLAVSATQMEEWMQRHLDRQFQTPQAASDAKRADIADILEGALQIVVDHAKRITGPMDDCYAVPQDDIDHIAGAALKTARKARE